VKAQELSRKYATAVFGLALEKWLAVLRAVQERLANDATLLQNLQNSEQPFSQRQGVLDQLIPAGTDQQIRNFLYTILRDGDIGLLHEVINELDRMTRGGPQVQVARVTTALPLSESDKEQFRDKLRQKYGQNLDFSFHVDPALMGGAVIQVGDQIIDASVATRLESLSSRLGVK
jgi:F-type H+-transporting ATPase subunit delta